MRTYKFEITVEEQETSGSFINDLINEVKEDNRQLDLTHKINRKTSEIHSQILAELVGELNEGLKEIGVEFGKPSNMTPMRNNEYTSSSCGSSGFSGLCAISPYLKIIGTPQRLFEESKYTTFTGEYQIYLGKGSEYGEKKVNGVKDILENLKGELKTIIANKLR